MRSIPVLVVPAVTRQRRMHPRAVFSFPALILSACVQRPVANPSFPLSLADARRDLRAMREAPKPLARPLVILGGYLDPGLSGAWVGRVVRRYVKDERVLAVHFPLAGDFDACRERVIEAVDAAFPTGDPLWTAEVDVIGVSMGGLVGRYAAQPPQDGGGTPRRLRIARLFTISSPHRGAAWASIPCFLRLHRQMRQGSPFLTALEAADRERAYELYPYVQLGDSIVGARNAAPPGEDPWWVPRSWIPLSHPGAVMDARIEADIARRLRGEAPYALLPRAPLPEEERRK